MGRRLNQLASTAWPLAQILDQDEFVPRFSDSSPDFCGLWEQAERLLSRAAL